MKKALTALALGTTLLLGACSPDITEGTVYNKRYHPEEFYVMMMPIVTSDGKTTTTTMIPMYIYNPETWEIDIKKYSKKEKKYLTEDYYVDRAVYDSVNVGTYFKFEEEMGDTDRPQEEREATGTEQEKYSK
ncbi:hypothetical protein [Phage f2b1]|nr:hypothetical protein [Phage f2b1]